MKNRKRLSAVLMTAAILMSNTIMLQGQEITEENRNNYIGDWYENEIQIGEDLVNIYGVFGTRIQYYFGAGGAGRVTVSKDAFSVPEDDFGGEGEEILIVGEETDELFLEIEPQQGRETTETFRWSLEEGKIAVRFDQSDRQIYLEDQDSNLKIVTENAVFLLSRETILEEPDSDEEVDKAIRLVNEKLDSGVAPELLADGEKE